LSPARLVGHARSRGITALALTDHDTLDGIAEARDEGLRVGVELVPGIELSTQVDGVEVHVLGLFVDPDDAGLRGLCDGLRARRLDRVERICERLRDLGMAVTSQDVRAGAGPGTVGRPHVARALVERGYVRNVGEAFDRFLATGRPAYVVAHDLTTAGAIEAIRSAGGVAALAHPGTIRNDALVTRLATEGLDAIEAHHAEHDAAATDRYRRIATDRGLGITGGSDYHGSGVSSHHPIGGCVLPWDDYLDLRERHRRRVGGR